MPDLSIKIVFTALLLAVFSLPAFAGPAEDAEEITNRFVSQEQFIAVMVAGKAKLAKDTRAALSKDFDLSKVSDADFDVYLDILIHEMSSGMAAGMRFAFKKKLVSELSENDLKIMLACVEGKTCETSKYSPKALKTIAGLSKFGEQTGQRIGQSVGIAVNPRIMEIVKANKGNRFKNPKSVLDMLSANKLPQQ